MLSEIFIINMGHIVPRTTNSSSELLVTRSGLTLEFVRGAIAEFAKLEPEDLIERLDDPPAYTLDLNGCGIDNNTYIIETEDDVKKLIADSGDYLIDESNNTIMGIQVNRSHELRYPFSMEEDYIQREFDKKLRKSFFKVRIKAGANPLVTPEDCEEFCALSNAGDSSWAARYTSALYKKCEQICNEGRDAAIAEALPKILAKYKGSVVLYSNSDNSIPYYVLCFIEETFGAERWHGG